MGNTLPDDCLRVEGRRKLDATRASSRAHSSATTRAEGQRTTGIQRAHKAHVSVNAAAVSRHSLLACAHSQVGSSERSKGGRGPPLVIGEGEGAAATSVSKHTHTDNSKNTHSRVSTRRL